MSDDDRPVLLLTCSGISHTGKLTSLTGNSLRCRHPVLITRHLQLTALKRSLENELSQGECLIAVDGCDEGCVKKRMGLIGKIPDAYLVATQEGITKRGMEEPGYDEIEELSVIIMKTIRKNTNDEEAWEK